jgi:uroporphyrinogen decarboxylase
MGKELLISTLKHEKTDAVPWVPFAGVHAGKLAGYNAEEVLTDADKLYESLMAVHKFYAPDGMPIAFDLQIEAEVFGCELLWAKNNPPSVRSHPLADTDQLPCKCKIPNEKSGRIPVILETMRRVKASVGEDTALYGLVCGPFTLASHLRGTGIFMDMINKPEYVLRLVEYCGEVAIAMARMYLDAGMDVIAIVDPLVSQISPKHIDQFLNPTFTAVFDYIRSRGAYSCFFVCGNATRQIEAMCRMNPDCVSVDENVDLAKAKQTTDRFNIALGGNIPLTTTMLFGTQQDNMKKVIEILDSVDHHNLIVSPGCDMPYDTPVENAIAAAQAVKTPDEIRAAIANYESAGIGDIEIELPDYDRLDKALVELFTLDPDQCAACMYMVDLVKDNYNRISDIADYAVYRYNRREDIARTVKMGLTNLPTMCINGKPAWVSIIPGAEEFIAAVKEAYRALHQ